MGLEVRLFGDGEVRVDGVTVKAMASTRLRSLLGALVLGRDRPLGRERLAYTFWPDSSEGQARTNLRQALHHLRRALGEYEAAVRLDNQTVQWVADAAADVDVVTFEDAARVGLADGDEAQLLCAAGVYRGDLLQDCYDDWVAPERERLRSTAAAVLAALLDGARRRGDLRRALQFGRRLLRLDRFDESTYRRLMELHAAAGDRARAVRTYHECVAVLDRELGVAPEAATVDLYEAIVEPAPGNTAPVAGAAIERSPMFGRDREMQRLIQAWEASAAGRSQFVLVAGEAGIGKSRLVEHLRVWCGRQRVTTVGARAYEAEGAVPYGPIVDVLRSEVVRGSFEMLEPMWRDELARLLPELPASPSAAADVHGDGARRRLFEAIGRALLASGRPLVLTVDDVHWCDADSLDLLEFIVRFGAQAASPLLVVATAREEELASQPRLRSLIGRLHAVEAMVEVPLTRLEPGDATLVVRSLLGDDAASATVDRVVAAAEGNPLFLVELVRHGLVEEATGASAALPPHVQSVIERRLDQLSEPARQLAAAAAVVGRQFTLDILSGVAPQDDAVAAIDELWRRGIVHEHGLDGYDFSHDKIREVAYRTIGPARRRHLHLAVAAALHAAGEPGGAAQIAAHFEHAGQVDAAIAAYRRAVDAAVAVFAQHDAITWCRRGLQLVGSQPPGVERDDLELGFLVPLGVALLAGPGIAVDDALVYERARELLARRGLVPDPSTLRLSANAAIVRRDFHRARDLGRELLDRGEHDDDSILVTEGHYLIGVTSFWLGELALSRHHLEQALTSNRPEHTPVHLRRFAQDPRAVCLSRLALTNFHLGDETRAARLGEAALAAAADTGHVYTGIYVRTFVAWRLVDSGDAERAVSLVDGMPPDRVNNLVPIAQATFTGWAHTIRGDPGAGVELLAHAQRETHDLNQLMYEPFVLLMLAESHARASDPDAALAAAVAARNIAVAEMPFHLPEATRLNGELLLATGGGPAAALALLDDAVGIAAAPGQRRPRTAGSHLAPACLASSRSGGRGAPRAGTARRLRPFAGDEHPRRPRRRPPGARGHSVSPPFGVEPDERTPGERVAPDDARMSIHHHIPAVRAGLVCALISIAAVGADTASAQPVLPSPVGVCAVNLSDWPAGILPDDATAAFGPEALAGCSHVGMNVPGGGLPAIPLGRRSCSGRSRAAPFACGARRLRCASALAAPADLQAEQVVEGAACGLLVDVDPGERGVAVALELVGQLGSALGDDAALDEDVHEVGPQLVRAAGCSG